MEVSGGGLRHLLTQNLVFGKFGTVRASTLRKRRKVLGHHRTVLVVRLLRRWEER